MAQQVQMMVLEDGEGLEFDLDEADHEENELFDRRFLDCQQRPLQPIEEASKESSSEHPLIDDDDASVEMRMDLQ